MANIGITEGMGKKIVEALKQQTLGDTQPVVSNDSTINMNMNDEAADVEFVKPQISNDDSMNMNNSSMNLNQNLNNAINSNIGIQTQVPMPDALSMNSNSTLNSNLINFTQKSAMGLTDMDGLEIPTNVAVLKQLITQLPSGVTRQTGAQIIKQTMEALGISMKSVLQEAQQVQESLNSSARECQASVLEYKRQIGILEKQSQKYQKQYALLNDIISLFIQTNNY